MIKEIRGMEVLDSRGNPTVAAEVTLFSGIRAVAIAPSGASTGKYEATELRDGDERYGGKGVLKAVENIDKEIAPAICSLGTLNQKTIDKALINLDGTDNKSRLGANATLAVSLAVARAVARHYRVPLYRYLGGISNLKMPTPMMNILNGGAHAANNIDIQEIMIVPVLAETFSEKLKVGSEIYHKLGELLKKSGRGTGVGDEGGFAPDLKDEREAIELILKAVRLAGYSDKEVKIALDIASSEWFKNQKYILPKSREKHTGASLIEKNAELIKDYPIISVEDPLAEEDYAGWKDITSKLSKDVMLVGDDLFVTNPGRFKSGIEQNLGNAILIKPNQIGTLSETLEVINLAKASGYKTIISHRSGDTEDTFIADLAVAVGAGFIKSGAPCRTDRIAKYNRLLKIESEITRA